MYCIVQWSKAQWHQEKKKPAIYECRFSNWGRNLHVMPEVFMYGLQCKNGGLKLGWVEEKSKCRGCKGSMSASYYSLDLVWW